MFHSPFIRRGLIVSDEGFCIILRTRYQIKYQDNNGLTASFNYDAVFPNLDLLMLSADTTRDGVPEALAEQQREQV